MIGIGDLEKTPEFEYNVEKRFEWGIVDVYLKSRHGNIEEIQIFSDSLFPPMIEELMQQLKGVSYDGKGIVEACAKTKKVFAEVQGIPEQVEQFQNWLAEKL